MLPDCLGLESVLNTWGSKLCTGLSSKYITLWALGPLQQLLNSAIVASIDNIQMNGCGCIPTTTLYMDTKI